ncbi:cucumber peeling cupredoxin-like [Lactuca sativa]|uniref:Phytocyanin domain-containing protein n=1 Tax=Lactuca sativa TaxID=4236 RepID=A0A9R1VD19_LACSA|nr:cucumber peeling cupredoxin-like [Lactuca sativa]KAJ0203915.1 hypothetical protein LSAT_V11C500263180 [Lactuca sativa]
MAGLRFNLVVMMAFMLASVQFHDTAAQTTHVVGDALGWNIPPNGPSAYTTWASTQTFRVGDVLLFNFTTGFHNVAEVSQVAYGPCTTTNPISIATTGPARVTLNAPGTHYYVCTVGTHCQIGQKLTINVSAGSTTPAPAPTPATPAPVSPPTTTPTPAPTTTTPPPTSSPVPSAGEASPISPPTSGQSPSGSNTPSPTDSTTLPPQSPSFAPSFTAVVPFSLLAIALAFFY